MAEHVGGAAALNDRRREIVLALAEHDLNALAVARAMYFSHNAVRYHCEQIHKKTGLNPRRFYDLVKLVEMVKDGDSDG